MSAIIFQIDSFGFLYLKLINFSLVPDKKELGFVNKATKGVSGRQCTIKEIPWAQAREFLNTYHLLSSGAPVKINIGAFDSDDNLVAVMIFGKPAREQGKVDYYEMTRFVTDKKTHPGLASKMFKYSIENFQFSKIYAFVDRRWFTGEFKTINGFNVISETKPSKWYTDGNKRFHRRFVTKSRLLKEFKIDENITKDKMLQDIGLNVIYDCGKLKLEWKK